MLFDLKNRTPQELIVLWAAGICLCGQIPFAFMRLLQGDLWIAFIDAIGALICITAIHQVYQHKRVRLFGAVMSISAVTGIFLIVAKHGVHEIHFLYPVLFFTYFLLQPKEAMVLSWIVILSVAGLLYGAIEPFHLLKIGFSLLGCSAFAYTFSILRIRQQEKLLKLSTRDGLTGVLNRRSLDEKLNEFVAQTKRHALEAALIVFDLDDFKQINDVNGHAAGDQALKRVADTIQQRIRVTDSLYRYGGDEFVVFVADSNIEQAMGLAEDLRARVEATEAMEGSNISISLGVAVFQLGTAPEVWLHAADTALLAAKRGGRNQVMSEMVPG